MKINKETKKILLSLAACFMEAIAASLMFFAEYYNICIEKNYVMIAVILVLANLLLIRWHELLKKVENM